MRELRPAPLEPTESAPGPLVELSAFDDLEGIDLMVVEASDRGAAGQDDPSGCCRSVSPTRALVIDDTTRRGAGDVAAWTARTD